MSAHDETAIQQRLATCVHFNGIGFVGKDKCCEAGVSYLSVRDSAARPYRWPCLTIDGNCAATTCEKRQLPTREQAEAEERQLQEHIGAFLKELAAGKTCPHCHKPIESRKVIGRCQYVYPCGHRLGQVATEDEP